MTNANRDKPGRSRTAVVIRWLTVLVLLAFAVGAWKVYRGVSVSLQAENTLHPTLFTIHVVDQFVAENGRWPRSWEELETGVRTADWHGYDWPATSLEIQRHVSIDFTADPMEIARQDPMSFTAIKPIGPFYEYRDYSFVPSLQATIRKAVKDARRE